LKWSFLVALGQSLLGNYAQEKQMVDLCASGEEKVGRAYRLLVREQQHLASFLDMADIDTYPAAVTDVSCHRRAAPLHPGCQPGRGFHAAGAAFSAFFTPGIWTIASPPI
jgi:hypothetical protein